MNEQLALSHSFRKVSLLAASTLFLCSKCALFSRYWKHKPTVARTVTLLNLTVFVTYSITNQFIFYPTVGAAYEGVQKRTFLAMSIMISLQIPLILILLLLYRKLGRMKEKLQVQLGSTAAPVSGESSTSEKEPGLSDEEDTTEMTELLHHMGEKD